MNFSHSLAANMRLDAPSSVFLLCDLQERFLPIIYKMPHVLHSSNILISASKSLNIPMVVTEQYPKALGHTISSLDVSGAKIFEKTKFSMLTDEVASYLVELKKNQNRHSAVLFGSEAHVCVLQTAFDLIEQGFSVHVVVDAVSSQRSMDRTVAIRKMEKAGVTLTTTESLLFELIRDKNHPKFKDISSLAKLPLPEDRFLD